MEWNDGPTLSSPTSQHWPFLTTGLSSTMPSLYGNWVSVERKWCIASRGFNKPEDRWSSKRETNRQIAMNCGLGKSSFANIAGIQGIPRVWPCGNCRERIGIGWINLYKFTFRIVLSDGLIPCPVAVVVGIDLGGAHSRCFVEYDNLVHTKDGKSACQLQFPCEWVSFSQSDITSPVT